MIIFTILSSLNIKFDFTIGSFLTPTGTYECRIFYAIPRKEVTYIKQRDKFVANIQILCFLLHKEEEIGDMWIIRDTVCCYKATEEKEPITGELRLSAPPGDYKFKIIISDLNSQRQGEKSSKVRIKEFETKYPQCISSIRWYKKEKYVEVFFEAYNFKGERFKLFYEINEIKDSLTLDTSFINPVTLNFPIDSFGFGKYTIKVSIGEYETIDSFYIETPIWRSKEYKKRVEELYYIAEQWEIDSLLRVPAEEREKEWKRFWVRKDSIFLIGKEELEKKYFERVEYANTHFRTFREGWKTDRGRVYIKLGKPDEIISYPFEIDRSPYEVWYYYSLDLKFIFVDKQGFGEYTLEYPPFWDEKIRF
jgi:GWxTD domain-containing protein